MPTSVFRFPNNGTSFVSEDLTEQKFYPRKKPQNNLWRKCMMVFSFIIGLVSFGFTIYTAFIQNTSRLDRDILIDIRQQNQRDLARQVCQPYIDHIVLKEPEAKDLTSSIGFYLETKQTPENHIEFCKSLWFLPEIDTLPTGFSNQTVFCQDALQTIPPDHLDACSTLSQKELFFFFCRCLF